MKKIAVIAHDRFKPMLCSFLAERKDWLWGKSLVATGRTAEALEKASPGLDILHVNKGESGGYQEITRMIKSGEISFVIFFRDPSIKQANHEDIQALLDACDNHNVPIATNALAAELIIIGLIKKETARR
ncbi:methylglyoxal synthase [Schleiferia thermophila]|uniref:Methylglyoxal synthase n=1 Tax=Schleiferia thermophila TaxID=884107 RepID=A0A368ZYD8_9FLAO|nr:methylglyoxal synthase [Schleiferia thermophila]RCX02050.1 methylglyoxal synthase [Schleiferia thermophila]GCD80574.1 methylglyoxal synthase [Schleiferia thermophila]